MASSKLISEITTSLLTLCPKRMVPEEKQALENAYMGAFKGYSDKEIRDSCNSYLQDGDFYPPKPKDILSLIKNRKNEKHIKELIELYTCSSCHQKVSAISESQCLDCRGIPNLPANRVCMPHADEQDYKIESRIKCQECGAIGMCIKEPIKTGSWRCRKCYTGLTKEQIASRFRDLNLMMGDKEYKLNWQEELPF